MRIAVIGAGNVGRTLGQRWTEKGHDVVYGVREPSAPDEKSVKDAAQAAEAVLISLPWGVVASVLPECGSLVGKIVMDATNPILPDFSGLSLGTTDSAGEEVARLIPGAKVVKAFNTIGFNIMANPVFPSTSASLLVAGDDQDAKDAVMGLAADIGFSPVDAGPLIQSRGLEAFAWLWISMAMKHGHGREIAFSFMKR